MYYAFEMDQEVHKVERFHLKSACVAADGSIIVTGRGRLPGMREQVAFLIFRFDVEFTAGVW